MKFAPLPRPLRGIIPPLVTPLLEQDRLDHAGLERLIERTLAAGVHGLFMLGSTGEGPSLSGGLRREVVECTCGQVAGRVPVLVGITEAAFTDAVAMADHAAGAGAAAVVHAGPYYFPISQDELCTRWKNSRSECRCRCFFTTCRVTPRSTSSSIRCADAHAPNIAGVKDSSGQLVYFKKLVQLALSRSDFAVLIGPEELLAEAIFMGAHGGVTGGANLDPALICRALRGGPIWALVKCRELSAQAIRMSMTLYNTDTPWSSYLHGIKVALQSMGICGDIMAQPFEPCGPGQRVLIERHVRELGLAKEPRTQ